MMVLVLYRLGVGGHSNYLSTRTRSIRVFITVSFFTYYLCFYNSDPRPESMPNTGVPKKTTTKIATVAISVERVYVYRSTVSTMDSRNIRALSTCVLNSSTILLVLYKLSTEHFLSWFAFFAIFIV